MADFEKVALSDDELDVLSNADFAEIARKGRVDGEISIDELKGVTPEVLARLKEYLKTKNSKGINTETLTKLNTLVLKIESSTPAVSSSDSNSQAPVVGKPELSKHSNESTPVVLNFIRAIELGLIGATPKENLAAFNAMKGNGVVKGAWNGLKAGNDRIPKAMNWANYFHTNPWIRPDLESAISMEKASNKALLANKTVTHTTREALLLREKYLNQMSEALASNNHVRFGEIATEYRADATSGKIAREAIHIDEEIAHSILKESIPEHEKATLKIKEKADKDLAESTKKIDELKAEQKRLEEEVKVGEKKQISLGEDITETDRLIAEKNREIGIDQGKYDTAERNHEAVLQKVEDLKNGTHTTAAITTKDSQITAMESRIGQKNTELTNLILTDTERTTLKEERAQLERSLDKLQSEKTHLIATEETRINREADGYKKIMEKSKDRIESFEGKISALEAEKAKLVKQQGELTRDITEKTNRKTAIGEINVAGELKTHTDIKDASELTIKDHESLQKTKVALETELAKPHPDMIEVNHLRTEYERLAGAGAVPTPTDRAPKANERMHQVEKVSYEQAKIEVDRIEARLSVIEGEIHTKLSGIDEQLKSGKITKAQAYIEVDKIISPYNHEFETVQKSGLAKLERLDPESFKKVLGQSNWLKTLNKGNVIMDKFDGKVGKWAGLAVVGLMVKHTADTGFTPELKNDLIDAGVGMIPIIGGVHDLRIAWNARDLNDRKVEGWDRAARVAFGVLGLTGAGSLVKWIGKGAQATELAIKSAHVMSVAKKVESVGESGIRLLEPVRLAGRPVMYTALGITLYQGTMSLLPSKVESK